VLDAATVGRKARLFVWRARRAVRRHGLVGAARAALQLVATLPASRRAARSSRAFDELHGVETAGIVHLGALDIDSADRDLGVRYQPSEPAGFRRLLDALPIDYPEYVFVDYGSGKGRVLLLASELPFKRIVGVEFSVQLNEIARANIQRFPRDRQRCAEIEVVTTDAGDYEPPPEPAVLYFYNPFAEPVLLRVLERVRASVAAHPRSVYLVFAGAVPASATVESAGLMPVEAGSSPTTAIYEMASAGADVPPRARS
jgi:hypothetical protein